MLADARYLLRYVKIGCVIQIWETRYAAGKSVARAMRIACWLVAAEYVVLVGSFVLMALFDERTLGYTVAAYGALTFMMLVLASLCITGALSVVLESAEKQRLRETPSTVWGMIWTPSPQNLMFATAFMPALALIGPLLAARGLDPNHSPTPVLNCFIIIAMASLGAMHVRCFWRIWRKMDREVKKGEEDLFRDFDWTLFDSDDRARFREKYPNTHWKFPADADCDAEIDCFIRRARSMHSRIQLFNAVIALLITFAVGELFRRTITAWVEIARNNGSTLLAMGVTFALFAIMGFFFLPLQLQRRATRYEDLRKDYEKYLEKRDTPPAA